MEDRALTLGEIAWDVLRRLVRELVARKPGGHLVEAELDRIVLQVPLSLVEGDADPEGFSRHLVSTIDQVLDDAIQHAASFRPGHAFCHRCGIASCEHSSPPSGRHVFLGYGPTGTPRWEDFAQVCLDLRHPEVDRLFDEPPAFLTLVQPGPVLNADLVGTGSQARSYELLGQVCAGFWPVRMREGEGRGVVALTFQVAASRPRHGRPRLGLNILGRTPLGQSLDHLWERQDDIPWRGAVRWAQGALGSVRPAVRSDGADVAGRVDGILRGLARRLERDRRARGRRTRHAELRHRSGERPTRKAVEDARDARPEEILVDDRSGTLVVPGGRGRTHFFTADGRLVSSVRYSREAQERKRKLGLWRAPGPGVADTLLERLRAIEDEDGRGPRAE